jgi:hypothetical protein
MLTRTLVLLVLLALLLSAHSDPVTMEQDFVQRINTERVERGLSSLSVSPELVAEARRWSEVMADEDDLYHNPSKQISGLIVAENVGLGPNVSLLHKHFMASDGHRYNILLPDVAEVGVGIAIRDHKVWVTQLFRLPHPPTPEPVPVPKPSPTPTSTPTRVPVVEDPVVTEEPTPTCTG